MEEADLGQGEVTQVVTEEKDGPGQRVDSEVEEEDSPVEEDSREGNLIKDPPLRDPMYLAKLMTKVKTDVIIVIKEVILQLIALKEKRVSHKNHLRERSLKTIPMLMEVLKNPN